MVGSGGGGGGGGGGMCPWVGMCPFKSKQQMSRLNDVFKRYNKSLNRYKMNGN